MANAFETDELTKIYGEKKVLNKINVKIKEKGIHGLIGLNGAGKSTLLKIFSGMTDPTYGSIKILGLSMPSHFSTIKLRLGYLPENPVLYRSLTVSELLGFVGTLNGIAKDLLNERVEKYSNLLGYEDLTETLIGNLSIGETQKVAITTVLVKEPQIYLLDDPFNSLDPLSQLTLSEIFVEKIRAGSTILFATHNLQFVSNLCDSVTMLSKGSVVFNGDKKDFMVYKDKQLTLEDSFINRLRGS